MDQKKIGIFISQCRKEKNMTQRQLAQQLNVSDKTVSKWERGINLPDASLYIPLCELLGLTLDEFFMGEYKNSQQIVKTLSTEELKKEYQKKLVLERWNIGMFLFSMFSVPLCTYIWAVELGWLRLERDLRSFANLWYVALFYFVAYFLIFKKKKYGYYMMWIIFGILSTGIIACFGYSFDRMMLRIDFLINIILTILAYYNHKYE